MKNEEFGSHGPLLDTLHVDIELKAQLLLSEVIIALHIEVFVE